MNVIISKDNPWSRELANLFLEDSSQFVWITECNLQILDLTDASEVISLPESIGQLTK